MEQRLPRQQLPRLNNVMVPDRGGFRDSMREIVLEYLTSILSINPGNIQRRTFNIP